MKALLVLLLVSTALSVVLCHGDVSVDQKQGVNIASEGESGGGSTAAPEPETTAGGCGGGA